MSGRPASPASPAMPLGIGSVVLMLCASWGCVALSSHGPLQPRSTPEVHIPTAEINEGRLPAKRRGHRDRMEQSLAAGRSAQVLGWFWAADVILAQVAGMDEVKVDPPLLARVLLLRGLVSLHMDQKNTAAVRTLLKEAMQAEPGGSLREPLELALGLLGRLSASTGEVSALRDRLTALQQVQNRDREESQGLRTEMEALQRQLEELKEVHLQLESEKVGKKDDSSQ